MDFIVSVTDLKDVVIFLYLFVITEYRRSNFASVVFKRDGKKA